ncbi:MAG: hypothetical protein U5L46_10550 [Agrobacterium sp.]|nr:hypothetical protein [Agrobacterium sp.]
MPATIVDVASSVDVRSIRATAPMRRSTPIAVSTWLSPTLPDEQAEPADSATPSISKAI